MNKVIKIYTGLLILLIISWLIFRYKAIIDFERLTPGAGFLPVVILYLLSHVFRLARLSLLTLDQRDKIAPLNFAHVMTAIPSSFLPFKIGEVLRLFSFCLVYKRKSKAVAVWMAERFGDIVVIIFFIGSLYFLDVKLSPAVRMVFLVFVMAIAFALLFIFATTKTFIYLNRYLVLSSHSKRGLRILRASHAVRVLELEIYRSVKGRMPALIVLSIMVWGFEIASLSLFIQRFSIGEPAFPDLFLSGLLASLSGNSQHTSSSFGIYQSIALILLTIIFPTLWFFLQAKKPKA